MKIDPLYASELVDQVKDMVGSKGTSQGLLLELIEVYQEAMGCAMFNRVTIHVIESGARDLFYHSVLTNENKRLIAENIRITPLPNIETKLDPVIVVRMAECYELDCAPESVLSWARIVSFRSEGEDFERARRLLLDVFLGRLMTDRSGLRSEQYALKKYKEAAVELDAYLSNLQVKRYSDVIEYLDEVQDQIEFPLEIVRSCFPISIGKKLIELVPGKLGQKILENSLFACQADEYLYRERLTGLPITKEDASYFGSSFIQMPFYRYLDQSSLTNPNDFLLALPEMDTISFDELAFKKRDVLKVALSNLRPLRLHQYLVLKNVCDIDGDMADFIGSISFKLLNKPSHMSIVDEIACLKILEQIGIHPPARANKQALNELTELFIENIEILEFSEVNINYFGECFLAKCLENALQTKGKLKNDFASEIRDHVPQKIINKSPILKKYCLMNDLSL